MGTALKLRIAFDTNEPITPQEVERLQADSNLLAKLTAVPLYKPLAAVWRLIALSEIPYTGHLEYTRRLVAWMLEQTATSQGFSVMGGASNLLPCYNAMLVYSLSRLGLAGCPEVAAGVGWILQYQPLARNHTSTWTGAGAKRYGGCLKSTPCYIGVAKAVKALQAYRAATQNTSPLLAEKINSGVEYILQHQLYRRLADGEPITAHILDIAFPESYHLNLLELLQIIDGEDRLNDKRTAAAFDYLLSRKTKEANGWKVNFIYKYQGYCSFDRRGCTGEWVSYLIDRFLTRRAADMPSS